MELDIDLIKLYNMTADEYILLEMLRYKHYGKIRSYFTDRSYLMSCLDKLVLGGFIELTEYGVKYMPQEYKILKLPKYSTAYIDAMFEELLENYPKHVIRPNGIKEYLRVNTPKAKELYKKLTQGSKEKHDLIIASLRYQLALYAKLGKMMYMRKMTNWLANEEWEEFKDFVLNGVPNETEIDETTYGTNIL